MTPAEFRAAREAIGLSRAALAETLGIQGSRPQAGIEDWEAGRRRIPSTAAIAIRAIRAFGPPDSWPDPDADEGLA